VEGASVFFGCGFEGGLWPIVPRSSPLMPRISILIDFLF
jgi:hypothetical protein